MKDLNVQTNDVIEFEKKMIEEVRKWKEQRAHSEKSFEMAINAFVRRK
jgi:hypothetical protein